jgi:hypothetical protein
MELRACMYRFGAGFRGFMSVWYIPLYYYYLHLGYLDGGDSSTGFCSVLRSRKWEASKNLLQGIYSDLYSLVRRYSPSFTHESTNSNLLWPVPIYDESIIDKHDLL